MLFTKTFVGIFTVPKVTAVGRRQTQEAEKVQSYRLITILTDKMASSYGVRATTVCPARIWLGGINFRCGS
jgi:hypothetical protein